MENKQKALEMAAAMQQKEKSGSLLWCVAEDLKATIQSMNEEEAKVIVADLEAGTHDLKTCEKAIHDYANKHKSGGSACCPGPACRVSCACILACRRAGKPLLATRVPHPPRQNTPSASA